MAYNFKVTLLSLLIFLIYLCIGSVVFYFIEHNLERQKKKEILDLYYRLEGSTCMNFEDFEGILKIAWSYPPSSFRAMDPSNNATANNWQWDAIGSFFFSFVVLTTIGFGNQAPTTTLGQVSVIIFSLIGIPICLNAIANLSRTATHLIYKLESCMPPCLKKHSIIIGFVFAMTCFILIFLIPAAFFALGEDWTYHESLYFTFITLSTIGFGDYIAGVLQPDYCQLLLTLWMLLGLVYVTTMISFMQISLEKFSTYLSEKNISIGFLTDMTKAKSPPKNLYENKAQVRIQNQPGVNRTIKTPNPTQRRQRY